MSNPVIIVVGQTFEVVCETYLANLSNLYSNWRIYYKKPDGAKGYLVATVVGTTLVATISTTLNPLTGVPGKWYFYTYVQGSGSVEYRGETDHQIVSKEYQE